MADVSNRLRAARERAGLEINDVAAITKIKACQLQAIERGEFERLPGEFFTRAFLRTYAREVGVSQEDIIREYEAGRGAPERDEPASLSAERSSGGVRRTAGPVSLLGADREEQRAAATTPLQAPRSAWPVLAIALVLLAVISVVSREPGVPAIEAGAVAATGAPEAPPLPAPTSGAPAPVAASETLSPETLSIEISPRAEIWISAAADGERAIYRLVQPGERLSLTARDELSFRIGNAAAFEYSINGVQGRSLGASGEVRDFQITRENVRTYHR